MLREIRACIEAIEAQQARNQVIEQVAAPSLTLQILSVPRGCQIGADGVIRNTDGTPATAAETAFVPYTPTPDFPVLPPPAPGPAEPLPVIDLEAEPAITRIDRWRDRKRDDDEPPGAA